MVIDEAQNASNDALEMIRHIHMDPDATWDLVIAGVDLQERLRRERKLASRVGHWALFRPLEGDELVHVLHQLHPVLADVDPELLLWVDGVGCQGVLREWVKVTVAVSRLAGGGKPSKDHFRHALKGLTGEHGKLPR